jgi:hypothetical protein
MKLGLKLGTSSEDWEDFILTRLGAVVKVQIVTNKKLGVKFL